MTTLIKKIILNEKYMHEWGPLFFLSVLIGIVGGLGALAFRWMIKANQYVFFELLLPRISFYVHGYNLGIIVLPALGGLIVGLIILKFARETKGHGVPEIIEAIHLKGGIIRPIVAFVKIFVSSMTIGSGGSAGREGPIAQIGAVFGSMFGRLFFNKHRRYIRLAVACGVAAGIAATFNAPLGGAVFALEVIASHAGLISVVPILVSAVVGDVVTGSFLGFSPAFAVPDYVFQTPSEVPIFFIIGGFFGLLSFLWTTGFYKIEDFFDKIKIKEGYKAALGGAFVGVLGMFFFQKGIMGVGYEGIDAMLLGKFSLTLILILGLTKMLATSFTVGSGGSGGIFAPTLYIGSMFGAAVGLITNNLFPHVVTHPYAFALIGMGALFAGACKAPLTALVMIPEMTGNHHLLVPIIIVSVTSYFVMSLCTNSSMYLMKLERRGVHITYKENPLEDILVEEVMVVHPDVMHPNDKLSDAVKLMLLHKHPALPVVKNDIFKGFITVYNVEQVKKSERGKVLVKDVMLKEYPIVFPHDSVYHALNLMTHHNKGRLPIVDDKDHKKIIAVVSKTDIIKAYKLLID